MKVITKWACNFKIFFMKFVSRYTFKQEKMLLGRWNLKYPVMSRYEGKNYPY